jgi:hypothetical protein
MTGDELPPTEAELRDAEALARALEHGEPGPLDALGAAQLLRASRGELSELRQRAVLEHVWRSRRSWRIVLMGAVAAAAACLFFLAQAQAPARLPDPPIQLLRAQLAAARPGAPAEAQLDAEMAGYRRQVFAALERRYGGVR